MAIINGYCTLADYKVYAKVSSEDSDDEALIEDMIETASRFIDTQSIRTFYARTETRYYNVPTSRTLRLDDDLLTITTLTNGDGTEIANTEYHLLPKNVSPKYAIQLKSTSSILWLSDSSGGLEYVISVAGTWGWVASEPANINTACKQIVKHYLGMRSGQNVEGVATITGAGVVITPAGSPSTAMDIIHSYRKHT